MSTREPQDFSSSELSLSKRFQLRVLDLAKQGQLGSLKTRHLPLQKAYVGWVSLLDHPLVPTLLFGEAGAGKSRHTTEYFVLHQFHNRLQGQAQGRLLVYRAEFLVPGFTKTLLHRDVGDEDFVVIEALHALKADGQVELRDFLLQRKQGASGKRFRILFTTEKALSVAVIRKEFDRTLFQLITEFAVFLPSLHERSEDHPLLLRDLLVELGAKQPESSVWLVNAMSRSLWSGNISELKKSLASLLAKQSDTRLWTASMVASWGGVDASTFEALDVTAAENQERQRRLIQGTLLQVGGDRTRAAFKLGLSREELLRRMFQMGLR